MSILRNGNITKYKLLHNGQKLKKAFYNGVTKLWSAGALVTYKVDTADVHTEEVDSEESCLEPKTFVPSKDDWNFHGWREDAVASGDVLPEKIMDDDPITLYAVFKKPIALTYHGNGADSPKHYTWYKNNGCNYVKIVNRNGDNCLDFHYDYGKKAVLKAHCLLDNPIYFDESIQVGSQYIVIETDFEVYQPYGTSATGFEFSVRMRDDDPGNILLKLEQSALYRHMGSVYGYVKKADYKQGKNHLKIMIDKSNKQTSYFLNGVLVEGDLPSRNKTNTDVGQIRIYTPAETKHYEKILYLYNLKVYELNTEGTGTVHVNEDYSQYATGTGLDSTVGVVADCKSMFYNNKNVAVPIFTLAENVFIKDNFSFAGWDLGEVGKAISIAKNTAVYAQWVETVTEIGYTGKVHAFTVPADGLYKLEVWGARGGNSPGWHWYSTDPDTDRERWGGLGGYSYGNVVLNKGEIIYVCVGGQGGDCKLTENGNTAGGYNGGGSTTRYAEGAQVCGGGGCTHIGRFNTTLAEHGSGKDLSDEDVLKDVLKDVFIVAGGGGGSSAAYSSGQNPACGGAGGGASGGEPVRIKQDETITGLAGTQTGPGGTERWYPDEQGHLIQGFGAGGFGYGGDTRCIYAGAGGGGLYGGGGGINYWSGGGGSGYIGGVIDGKTLQGGFTLDEYRNVVLDDNRIPVPNGEEGYIPSGTADGKARITYLGAV